MRRAVFWLAFAPVAFLVLVSAAASRAATTINLSGPLIVHAQAASDLEQLAARELLRYLYRGSGKVGAIAADSAVPGDPGRTRILLDVAALPWGNLPNAAWDLDDWKYYYDQLSKKLPPTRHASPGTPS